MDVNEIRDLGSRNGLWVEGSRTGAGPLRAGARIQLGGLILVAESLGFIRETSSMATRPARRAKLHAAVCPIRSGPSDLGLQGSPTGRSSRFTRVLATVNKNIPTLQTNQTIIPRPVPIW